MQSDLMEFNRRRSPHDIDYAFIEEHILTMHGKVVHVGKIATSLKKEMNLYLEYHDERSLKVRISITLKRLYGNGKIKYFGKNNHYILYLVE